MLLHTHTHLLRNIFANYWCGMHLTCTNISVKPDRIDFLWLDARNSMKEIFLRPCSKVHQVLMQLKTSLLTIYYSRLRQQCRNEMKKRIDLPVLGLAGCHWYENWFCRYVTRRPWWYPRIIWGASLDGASYVLSIPLLYKGCCNGNDDWEKTEPQDMQIQIK